MPNALYLPCDGDAPVAESKDSTTPSVIWFRFVTDSAASESGGEISAGRIACGTHQGLWTAAAKELEGILKIAPGQKDGSMRLIELYSQRQSAAARLDAEHVARDGDAGTLDLPSDA